MPGAANHAAADDIRRRAARFIAEGIPLTPYDDAGHKNTYPLMRLVARDGAGTVLRHHRRRAAGVRRAQLPRLPRLGFQSGGPTVRRLGARPRPRTRRAAEHPAPARRPRGRQRRRSRDALATAGYDAAGLFATATGGTPILCARCHLSEALPGSGIAGIEPLTQAVHRRMANVPDPVTGLRLDDIGNRIGLLPLPSRLGHPLPARGDGRRRRAGRHARHAVPELPRLDDGRGGRRRAPAGSTSPPARAATPAPRCTTTAQLRYTSVFETDGAVRQAVGSRPSPRPPTSPPPGSRSIASRPDTAACAAKPVTARRTPSIRASHRNDNLQSTAAAGPRRRAGRVHRLPRHACRTPSTAGRTACTRSAPSWVQRHPDAAEEGGAQRCQACHGADYRGTVAVARQGRPRRSTPTSASKHFWPGFQIGCYTCHRGPNGEQANPNRAPSAADGQAATAAGISVDIPLTATDARRRRADAAHRQPSAARHRRPRRHDRALHPRARLQRRPTASPSPPPTAPPTATSPPSRSRSAPPSTAPATATAITRSGSTS